MFRQTVIYSLCLLPIVLAYQTPSPRWAQAVSVLENTLYVHGGLCDPSNTYSYTSAPQTSDLLVLDLSTSFSSSSPPWQFFSSSSWPGLAWHTLSAFNPTELLLFGGQPNPNSLTVLTTLNDSSGLLSTSSKSSPFFLTEQQNWAHEPMRRIRHSASYASGKVWLIGGEKADGSGNAFGDHYSFSPSGPEFIQLPSSSNAPPDIYGHASLALPNGRLLVLGGYCASCGELVPMNMIWSLNTTEDPPVWEGLSVSNKSLPSPRRDFAAVVLSSGQVLIHGGGDAQLETTYSDGWMLDSGQNPMVWISVPALAQLGERKDHLAVQVNNYVFFCFGYGSSGPASASLFIYDPTTSMMVTSYTAPSPGSTPAVTSLMLPTQTNSNPNSQGGTGSDPGGSSSTPSHTSSPFSSPSNNTTAIALGTTFGVLGLVAGGLATTYYLRQGRHRRQRTIARFSPLGDDPESSSTDESGGTTVPEAAHFEDQIHEGPRVVAITDILAHLGISKSRPMAHQPRKDMFADEDTRSFGWAGHSSVVRGQDSERTSIWSLRSMGALVRGVIGGETSGSGVYQGDHEWEKIGHVRDGGQEGSTRRGSLRSKCSSHPAHRKDGSFWSYTDPFEDPVPGDDHDDLNLCRSIPEKDADYEHAVLRSEGADDFGWSTLGHQDSVRPLSVRSHMLTPLREVLQISPTDPSNSLSSLQEPPDGLMNNSHADSPALSPQTTTSPMPHSPTTSRSSDPQPDKPISRYSIVSGSTLSHSHSISRPESWWSRLTRPPLLDRRMSTTAHKLLDFRDPTPAPPLVTLEETEKAHPTPPQVNDKLANIPIEHGRTLSSAHSGRTANTDSAEHLGGRYDVVQRLASDRSSSQRAPSPGSVEMTEQGMLATAIDKPALSENSMSGGLPHVDPPRLAILPLDHAIPLDVEASTEPLKSSTPTPTFPKRGVVTSRVKEYERRMSQELESQKIPTPRNTRRREEVPSRSRPTIQYGVVPHPSLFVANPDLGHIS